MGGTLQGWGSGRESAVFPAERDIDDRGDQDAWMRDWIQSGTFVSWFDLARTGPAPV